MNSVTDLSIEFSKRIVGKRSSPSSRHKSSRDEDGIRRSDRRRDTITAAGVTFISSLLRKYRRRISPSCSCRKFLCAGPTSTLGQLIIARWFIENFLDVPRSTIPPRRRSNIFWNGQNFKTTFLKCWKRIILNKRLIFSDNPILGETRPRAFRSYLRDQTFC